MCKLDINKVSFWTTIIFILVAPIENILRSEQVIYIICIAILAACVIYRRYLQLNNSKYIFVLMVYMFFSCYWSAEQGALGSLFIVYAELLFLFLQLQFVYSKEQEQKIKYAILLQNWLLLILCFTNGTYMDSRFWLKSATSGADPNYLSGWFVIPLCFAVEFLFTENAKIIWKIATVIQMMLSLYFIMQTASKSGFITSVCVIVFAILYTFRRLIREHPWRAFVVLTVFTIGFFVVFTHMPDYLVTRLMNGDTTGTGRFPMWVTLAKEMINNPVKLIIGFGAGSVKHYTGTGLVSHNTYLDLLFNEGIVGFFILIVFIIRGLKNKKRNYPYIVIAFIGMSILLLTLSAFNTRFFMLILFLLGMNIEDNDDCFEYIT